MNLLFELGTEELPAGEVETARAAIAAVLSPGGAFSRSCAGRLGTSMRMSIRSSSGPEIRRR